ncbi:hypothetical protein TNCV_4521141 [Trichonephila clavipes]|nr:hypothetical protein TNCV_4521141 [Trichonephila clavipes]
MSSSSVSIRFRIIRPLPIILMLFQSSTMIKNQSISHIPLYRRFCGHGSLWSQTRGQHVISSSPGTTEDPPCRGTDIQVKSFEALSPPVDMVWNFGGEGASSGVDLFT